MMGILANLERLGPVEVANQRAKCWRALGESNPSCKIENLES